MSIVSGSSREERASADQRSGNRLQLLLFAVGGLLFLGGIVAIGLPDTMPGGPAAGIDNGSSGGSTPTESARASPTGQPASTSTSSPDEPTAQPIHRVNVGGPRLEAGGGGPAWSADRADAPSQYLNVDEADTAVSDTPDDITVEEDVPSTAPEAMFKRYRIERGGDDPRTEEMVWRFPVDSGRDYEVRLYVIEAFFTDGEPGRAYEERYSEGGPRTFGVAIENEVVMENYEPIAEHGHDVGAVKSFEVTTDDDVLTIRFRRERENPTVSGIEIVETGSNDGESE